jgi:ABC-type molybdate transport system substrate-binding protein
MKILLQYHRLSIAIITVLVFAPIAAMAENASNEGITVIADSSVMKPLRALAQHYTRQHAIGITLIADSSHNAVEELSGGLAADVLVTGHARTYNALDQMGLTDRFASRFLVGDPIALVGMKSPALLGTVSGKGLKDRLLASSTPPVCAVLDARYFPEMQRVKSIIANSNLDPEPTIKLVATRDALKEALAAPNSFSAMPLSALAQYPELEIIAVLQEPSQRIRVRGEVLAGTRMQAARTLLAYLASDEAMSIWSSYGFVADE